MEALGGDRSVALLHDDGARQSGRCVERQGLRAAARGVRRRPRLRRPPPQWARPPRRFPGVPGERDRALDPRTGFTLRCEKLLALRGRERRCFLFAAHREGPSRRRRVRERVFRAHARGQRPHPSLRVLRDRRFECGACSLRRAADRCGCCAKPPVTLTGFQSSSRIPYVAAEVAMNRSVLDPFEDLSDWGVVASGLAELRLTHERDSAGPCMRLDYDFKGGGGFVVARRVVSLSLAHTYAFHFDVRGAAPRNKFELKLVDPSGKNVWRWQQDAFDFAADWQPMRIGSSQFEFAWGPAGGGSAAEVAAIEFAITAGPGGKGTVWISRLEVEDLSFPAEPTVTASTAVSGHEAGFAVDANPESRWRSVAGAAE